MVGSFDPNQDASRRINQDMDSSETADSSLDLKIESTLTGRTSEVIESHQSSSKEVSSAKQVFKEIGRRFKKINCSSFLVKIAVFFEKKFAKKHYIARHEKLADCFMAPTEQKIEDAKRCQVKRANTKYAYVPDTIMLSSMQRRGGKLDKKIGGKKALEKGGRREAGPFNSGKHIVTGYTVTKAGVESGKIVPTSARRAKDRKIHDHLMNCYLTEGDKGGLIRTGVIDTIDKAKEFETVVRYLHKKRGLEGPIRVMSHQLNSPERESAMIRQQHAYLLARNDRDFQVAHKNTPCNRLYHYHQSLGNVPIASQMLKGEAKSHEQNVEGMVQYLDWIMEDLKDKSFVNTLREQGALDLRNMKQEINEILKKIADLKNEPINREENTIKIQEKYADLKQVRGLMKSRLVVLH